VRGNSNYKATKHKLKGVMSMSDPVLSEGVRQKAGLDLVASSESAMTEAFVGAASRREWDSGV
jgi:hypothetical protein